MKIAIAVSYFDNPDWIEECLIEIDKISKATKYPVFFYQDGMHGTLVGRNVINEPRWRECDGLVKRYLFSFSLDNSRHIYCERLINNIGFDNIELLIRRDLRTYDHIILFSEEPILGVFSFKSIERN